VIGLAALVAGQVLLAVVGANDPGLFVLGTLFVLACAASFMHTLTGLVLLVLFQVRVLQGTSEISVEELAFAGLFLATVSGWALRWGVAESGRRVLRSPLGRTILIFLGVCVISIVPATLFDSSPLWWFRDLVRFSYLLLFFPVAHALRRRRARVALSLALLVVVLFHIVVTLRSYQAAVAVTRALWQVKYQRVAVHEVFATASLVTAFAVFLRARSRGVAAGAITLALASIATLVASLTRGYWLASALAMFVVALMTPRSARRVATFTVVVVGLVLAVGYAVFPGRFLGVIFSLADRFSTISSPLRVLSMQERLAETTEVLRLIRSSPFVGRGLGAAVSYMSPLTSRVVTRTYTHNAYLYIWAKLGLVGLVTFGAFYWQALRRSWQAIASGGGRSVTAIATAGFALLVAFVPLSLTSPQYYDKSSILVIVLILGAAEAVAGNREHAGSARGEVR